MNALALVIGNSCYTHEKHKLPNAAKDAVDVSNKLTRLGFIVDNHTDCTQQEFEKAVLSFSAKLSKYDVGLFYFAGHGLQIKGLNYLTAVDTNFDDLISAKFSSIELAMILEYMDSSRSTENSINIVVLDACRNNPFNLAFRGLNNEGLAPVNAPKGTIIAFSTSPGQEATDGNPGDNSVYARAFLNHIDDKNIAIEEFFKRVRTTVYTLTDGHQTSWEHTSLIGDFYFNDVHLNHSIDLPYSSNSIADRNFVSDGSDIHNLITNMKSYNYYVQGPALNTFKFMHKVGEEDKSSLFLMGRNILQAAKGGEKFAQRFMGNPSYWLPQMASGLENHVLNGILFEMYFDSYGRFRNGNFKNDFLNEIYTLEEDKLYESSFNMIRLQLIPFQNYIFYLPGGTAVPIEVKLETYEYGTSAKVIKAGLRLFSVKHQEHELFSNNIENSDSQYGETIVSISELSLRIGKLLMVPIGKLRFSMDRKDDEIENLMVPYNFTLKK